MQPRFINQDALADLIREKERGYLGTIVNLFLYPRFIELCLNDLEDDACTDERRDALEKMIESHKLALAGETQSLETWELLLPYLYSLKA